MTVAITSGRAYTALCDTVLYCTVLYRAVMYYTMEVGEIEYGGYEREDDEGDEGDEGNEVWLTSRYAVLYDLHMYMHIPTLLHYPVLRALCYGRCRSPPTRRLHYTTLH